MYNGKGNYVFQLQIQKDHHIFVANHQNLLQITKKIENDIFRKGYNKNILNILSISIF